MRIPPETNVLCRVDDRIQILKDLMQFGRLLLVFESKCRFTLKRHPCDHSKSSQRTNSSMEDIGLFCPGAVDNLSIGCDQCQVEYLE
jgi:hypothetical protein